MKFDTINKPKHYANKEIEVIDYIQDTLNNNPTLTPFEGYCLGNIIKYISRAGLKGNKIEDFQKAEYYLKRMTNKK